MLKIAHVVLVLAVTLMTQLAGSHARAESLDSPAAYVALDLEVRSLTVEGLRARAALLARPDYTEAADRALDNETQLKVTSAYRRYQTTASGHLAYGTHESKAVKAWLEQHPEAKARYAALQKELAQLSSQLNALRRK